MPQLSLVITTKNRLDTAKRSIAAALALMPRDVELIIQDCSDTPELEAHLAEHHAADRRVSYEHKRGQISVTDNWNLAIGRSTGDFVTIIGDDDAFLPVIADMVAWTARNGYLACSFRHSTYYWPENPVGFRGHLFHRPITGATTIRDTAKEFARAFSRKGFSLERVPQLYYGAFAREMLQRHHRRHGYFVRSTSPDFYSAFAMASQLREHPDFDYTGAVCGFSRHSNGARTVRRELASHVNEYTQLDWAIQLPRVPTNVQLIVADAMIKGAIDAGKPELLASMHLPRYYAAAIFDRPREVVALVEQLRSQPGWSEHLARNVVEALINEGRFRVSFRLLARLPPLALKLRGFQVVAAADVFEAAERQLELLAGQPLVIEAAA